MKYTAKRKLYLDLTLNSSEAVMFGQGGKHRTNVEPGIFDGVEEIEISVQIDRSQQGLFDHVSGRRIDESR